MIEDVAGTTETTEPRLRFPEGVLVCPQCGFDYLHLLRVEATAQALVAVVGAVAHRLLPAPAAGGTGRGSAVVLWLLCENGHRFAWSMHFHKGQVYGLVLDVADVHDLHDGGGDGDGAAWPGVPVGENGLSAGPELWRD
jgi:hypothetical protein